MGSNEYYKVLDEHAERVATTIESDTRWIAHRTEVASRLVLIGFALCVMSGVLIGSGWLETAVLMVILAGALVALAGVDLWHARSRVSIGMRYVRAMVALNRRTLTVAQERLGAGDEQMERLKWTANLIARQLGEPEPFPQPTNQTTN